MKGNHGLGEMISLYLCRYITHTYTIDIYDYTKNILKLHIKSGVVARIHTLITWKEEDKELAANLSQEARPGLAHKHTHTHTHTHTKRQREEIREGTTLVHRTFSGFLRQCF